jgi:hydrogenase maturation protease
VEKTYERVLVMGIGNVLMLDEGIGPAVIARLVEAYEFPPHVDVVDSGTMGMSILHLFAEYDYLIVVDAVDDPENLAPGEVVSFPPEQIAPNTVLHGLHDMRFVDVLQNAEFLGWRPDAMCVGVQIENINPVDLTEGLTPEVEAAIPVAIEAVITLLGEVGVEATKK